MTNYFLHGIRIVQSTDPAEVETEVARLLSCKRGEGAEFYELHGSLQVSVQTHIDTVRGQRIDHPVFIQSLLHWVMEDPM